MRFLPLPYVILTETFYEMYRGYYFFDFFSSQEKEKMVALFYTTISEVEENLKNDWGGFDEWKFAVKTSLINALNDVESNFGIKEIASRFQVDNFLLELFNKCHSNKPVNFNETKYEKF